MKDKDSKATTVLQWYLPDFDLSNCITSDVNEEFADYIEENKRTIYLQWEDDDYENLEKSLGYGSMILRHFANRLSVDDGQRVLFEIGTLKGTIESFEHLLFEKATEIRIIEGNKQRFSSIKHLNDVVLTLETHGSLTHTELCNYLDMRASTLTEAMKKILDTNLVLSSPVGKFKVYTLSDTGIKYGRMVRKKNNDEGIDDVLKLLDTLVTKITDSYEIDKIKDELYKTLIIINELSSQHQENNVKPVHHIYNGTESQVQLDATLYNIRRRYNDPLKGIKPVTVFPISNDNNVISLYTMRNILPCNERNTFDKTLPNDSRIAV